MFKANNKHLKKIFRQILTNKKNHHNTTSSFIVIFYTMFY